MNPKRISIAIAALLIGGLSVATHLPADPPAERPLVALIYPKEPADSLFWPRENCWLWSINRLDPEAKGKQLSLVVRVKSVPLENGKAPPNSISKAESDREIKLDQFVQNNPSDSALVSVQLVNLAKVAIPVEKTPYRLLLGMQRGAHTTGLLQGQKSAIEGIYRGTSSSSKPQWKDGELHLQCLEFRDGDELVLYDVVLIQSDR